MVVFLKLCDYQRMEKPAFSNDIIINLKSLGLLDSEINLLSYLRTLRWGLAEITIQNSEPIFAKVAYQTVKFKNDPRRLKNET